jgi:hypothetical protein
MGAAWVLLLHALLLLLLLWVWPRVERFRSVNESLRIEISLAPIEQAKPQISEAATAAAPITAKRKPKPAPIAAVPMPPPRTSLSFEPAAATPDATPVEAEAVPVPAPLPAASSVLGSAATKHAIKRALENKTLAQQAREQIGTPRALSIDERLGAGIKQAEIPECLGPNAGSSLILAPKLIYDALTGKCK